MEAFAKHVVGVQGFTQAVFGGQPPGGAGCRVASGGNVTDEKWEDYIKSQQPPEQDDGFAIM
jgi:hypothetical protein